MIDIKTARIVFGDYVALTKPPIVILLLITALGGMVLAYRGIPPISLVLMVMVGGAMASGGASALNHYLDRDIDSRMIRTRQRPVPSLRISGARVVVFGLLLNVVAFMILAAMVNLLSAILALSGTLFYVIVYTMYLKRSTSQNIVLGGAAGSVPPLVGWASVTGGIDLPALYLFAIIFFWTPPHFWALALLIRDDYIRARIPMLPVVKGTAVTKWSIFLYSLILTAVTLMFVTLGLMGWIYFVSAVILGLGLIYLSARLVQNDDVRRARHLYLYSLLYLALLFISIMIDSVVQG